MKRIKRYFIYLCLLAIIMPAFGRIDRYRQGTLVFENIPKIPPVLVAKLHPYLNVRYASFRDWLPYNDGILINTRFGETSQLHVVANPQGFRKQLTFFNEPVRGGLVCPDYSNPYLLFTKDTAGNEQRQIYKFNYLTGKYSSLTDGISRHSAIRWMNSGKKFSFSSTMRNGKDYDIYIGTLAGKESFQRIVEKQGWWGIIDFSPDDKKALVENYVSSVESYIYVLDIAERKLTELNPVNQKISYGAIQWSKDGRGLYLVSDQFSDYKQLTYYDLATREFDVLVKSIPWDVVDIELSPSGDTIAFITNEHGVNKLYFLNTGTRVISQAGLPQGLIYRIKYRPDGSQLAMVINTPRTPSDIYTLKFKNNTFLRWTYSEVGILDTSAFIEPEIIHYPTFDSVNGEPRLIPAFYYKPKQFKTPYPVLVTIHGGPEGQHLPYFSTSIQYYLNEMGIAVIAPNVRGSTGYGKEYKKLDNGYLRENSVKDIGALLDWIAQQPELDKNHIGVIGGSYGGYMVLASMVYYSDRLACGIDGWGISNFVTFLENTGKYRQDLRRAEYGDERDPEMREFLTKISPLTNAHKIAKPLFVVQGLNDPRVPVTEAEQVVEAVRKNDVEVWYLLAENEGHGFSKKSNRDIYRQAVILFLEKYLLK